MATLKLSLDDLATASMKTMNLSLDEIEDLERCLEVSTQKNKRLERRLKESAQECEKLKRHLEKSAQEYEKLEGKLKKSTQHSEKKEKLKGVLQQYETVIHEFRKEIEELKEFNEKLITNLEESKKIELESNLEQKNAELGNCNEELRTNLENSEVGRSNLTQKIFRLVDWISKFMQASNEREKLIRNHRATEKELKNRLEKLIKKNAELGNCNEELRTNLENSEVGRSNLTQKIFRLVDWISKFMQTVVNLREEKELLLNDLDERERVINELIATVKRLSDRVEELEQCISNLTNKLNLQELRMEHISREMENLKKENESLKNEISHWMNESAQKDRAIEALSMKNVSLKNELAAKNSKIEASAEEMETLKKLVQQFCIDIKILKKKIQELEKHNKELRMDCEKKCQSLMEAKSRERKLWSRLDKANDEKRQWIKNYEAAGQKLKDQNKELKEKELVKRELTRQMECLSKHLCQNNCVSLAVLHILSEMKISNWCEHILGKTAVLAALQNGADPSDKDLVCCTKAIQLLEKAAFVGCVAEGVEIAKVDDLLQQFKKHFPGVFGILAFLYPHKVGHAVAVKPASQVPILYCPQTGQHLRVEDFKQNGATVVSLYILNVDCIGKTKEQFSLTDDSRGIYCLGNFPGAAEF